MDYNLQKNLEPSTMYNVGDNPIGATQYNGMPISMLMSKFEETDTGPDEDLYDEYARGVLTDLTPDKNLFAHEDARGSVSKRSGVIQLRYEGHRGHADDPYRPEIFDGFGGPDDHDPRGINVDPDMKKLRSQEESRMRFVRWDPDACDHITSGHRSESMVIADQQKVFKITRDRLKVFSPSLEFQRGGTSRTYKHVSNKSKQILVKSYGDHIHDYALNPQRRVGVLCNKLLKDARMYRDNCSDTDFEIAKYTQLCRHAQTENKHKVVANARNGLGADFTDGDGSQCFKTAGILMSNIIQGKKQGIVLANGDIDMAQSKQTIARKTEPFLQDLSLILRAMEQGSKFNNSDTSITVKTAIPVMADHALRSTDYNHAMPAHHYLNAEILYKNVKPGADTRKLKNLVITDATRPAPEGMMVASKTAKMMIAGNSKLKGTADAESTESTRTFNYKLQREMNGDKRVRLASGDGRKGESDNTQNRRKNHQNYRGPGLDDTAEDMSFSNNTQKESLKGRLGSKYLHRFIEEDSRKEDITSVGAN